MDAHAVQACKLSRDAALTIPFITTRQNLLLACRVRRGAGLRGCEIYVCPALRILSLLNQSLATYCSSTCLCRQWPLSALLIQGRSSDITSEDQEFRHTFSSKALGLSGMRQCGDRSSPVSLSALPPSTHDSTPGMVRSIASLPPTCTQVRIECLLAKAKTGWSSTNGPNFTRNTHARQLIRCSLRAIVTWVPITDSQRTPEMGRIDQSRQVIASLQTAIAEDRVAMPALTKAAELTQLTKMVHHTSPRTHTGWYHVKPKSLRLPG